MDSNKCQPTTAVSSTWRHSHLYSVRQSPWAPHKPRGVLEPAGDGRWKKMGSVLTVVKLWHQQEAAGPVLPTCTLHNAATVRKS